jgi:hypothetical protein
MRKRPIPKPIINAWREEFRSVLDGEIEGEDVYLLMADPKGRSHHVVHYVASPDFMKAVRACDSGIENFDRLCGEEGFELTLLSPSQRKLYHR